MGTKAALRPDAERLWSVEARGLAAGYARRAVWSDASFEIAAGEFVAVLGPNGSGKSTLLRVLLGLVPPIAGEVFTLGHKPHRGDPAIGYVPQRRTLGAELAIRGRDLVGLGIDGHRWGIGLPGAGARARAAAIDEAIAAVQAQAYAHRPLAELSGGELQRLLLAQALIGTPQLVLLDEPLASLDMRNQIAVSQLIARLSRERGFSTVLVTHDVNPLLSILDRVLYVAAGRVLCGTPEEVITTEALSRLYGTAIEVLRDSRGRLFVVGLDEEVAHPHGGDHPYGHAHVEVRHS
jgi:zinc/manganese transport system ATP-binding protein